jgi:CheY-like chemotaxis protein
MPGQSGPEVARIIRADSKLKHLLIVGLTGSAMADDIQHFLDAGIFNAFFSPCIVLFSFSCLITQSSCV